MLRMAGLCSLLASFVMSGCDPDQGNAGPSKQKQQSSFASDRLPREVQDVSFDSERAMKYLKTICKIGPRVSGSEGMDQQQELLTKHFEECGAEVRRQEFKVRHPLDGSAVPMANLIASWHTERRQRVLLCAHYDTRPFPDRDPVNPKGEFVGANDGASGTALLMQLARGMPELDGKLGVDIVQRQVVVADHVPAPRGELMDA